MVKDAETTSSAARYGEERGAGGKLRKARKPPATPYARPPAPAAASEAERGQRRWLSKLVDPACRLISGGASLIFPSFFSNSSVAGSDTDDHGTDDSEAGIETQQDVGGSDQNCTTNHEVSRATGVVGPSRAAHVSESISDLVRQKQDAKGDLPDENGLSEIECLLKDKKFSRDEVSRLVEIIRSRAVEPPIVETEKKHQIMTSGGETKAPAASQEIVEMASKRTQRDLQTSTPLPQSTMPDVAASPVDIAKAFMGSRRIDAGNSLKGIILRDERSLPYGAELASKPYLPPPSPKPSAYWPGAMVHDRRDYFTPQTHRGRFGLQNFPRTPYSRTIFSKSKSKFTPSQGDSDKWLRPPTSVQKLETPVFGQLKSRSEALEDDHGSVGPIRRSRHKLSTQTPFRGSTFIGSSSVGPSKVESSISQGFLPAVSKNFEPRGSSSSSQFQSVDRRNRSFDVSVPTVHPQSSQIARTILEHIDRNPPTPKDKSEELKLAIAWKKPVSSSTPSSDPNGKNSLLNVKGYDSHKIVNLDGQKDSAQENADKGNALFMVPRQENPAKAVDSVINLPRSDVLLSNGGSVSQTKSSHEDGTMIASSQMLHLQKKPATSATKPVLTSISIDNPVSKWTFSSNQSSGFTFPVSTPPEVLSEPPTPSIIPSFSSTSSQHEPKDEPAVPSFTFGSTKSSAALVFSFPSTSSAALENDSSDIKFSFGSDKPRLSFGSIKKDAICY